MKKYRILDTITDNHYNRQLKQKHHVVILKQIFFRTRVPRVSSWVSKLMSLVHLLRWFVFIFIIYIFYLWRYMTQYRYLRKFYPHNDYDMFLNFQTSKQSSSCMSPILWYLFETSKQSPSSSPSPQVTNNNE